MKKRTKKLLILGLLVGSASAHEPAPPMGSYGDKSGIGTAYQAYGNKAASKVWFSLSHGMITETTYGLIHETQLRDVKFIVKGEGFLDTDPSAVQTKISYLDTDAAGRPLSLAYRIINRARNGRYEIEQHVFTDPKTNVVFLRAIFRSLKGTITPYLVADPMIGGKGSEQAQTDGNMLHAYDGGTDLVITSNRSFAATSVGFADLTDGTTDLRAHGHLAWHHTDTSGKTGNVSMTAELAPVGQAAQTYDFVIGFGHGQAEAASADDAALRRGYATVLDSYNGKYGQIGWQTYLASLDALPGLVKTTTDGGKLLYASALVLKACEDKTYPGALIASPSTPWGETVLAEAPSTGYRAVWPRDFYQSATALLALGDRQTPLAALNYVSKVQVSRTTQGNRGATGWFLQKTHVDGTREWDNVQLDETAMPIMLAWKLAAAGLIDTPHLDTMFKTMLKPAADFLTSGGTIDLPDNHAVISPPRTQEERWEEQSGYSPSTTASVITGLIAAAEIATQTGAPADAARYRSTADMYARSIHATMFTAHGSLAHGQYFLRISPDGKPNDHSLLGPRNGRPGLPEDAYLDGGFLELVRYGVLGARDPSVIESLDALDDRGLPEALRVRYEFAFPGVPGTYPGWRRYGNDGYGEDTRTGEGWRPGDPASPPQRGRVWPLLTGERGQYELARALAKPGGATDADRQALRALYVRGMELFANDGLMLPEQVWDGVGQSGDHVYLKGHGTGSATPLAWSHAEYVKLVRSLNDRQVWDLYAPVRARYAR